jgi:NADH-quinone oxidoreductase subunit L/multicomponent Na+:H+ antiporter subunit D
VLNIAYFWPIVYTAFFESHDDADPKPVVATVLGGRFATDEVAADGGQTATADDTHDHHGGPWERHAPTGAESTWFMLGPILVAASGSVVLGVLPDTAIFLRIVRLVVASVTGVTV